MMKWTPLLISALPLLLWHGSGTAAERLTPKLSTVVVAPQIAPAPRMALGPAGGDWQAGHEAADRVRPTRLADERSQRRAGATHWGIVGTGIGFIKRF